jgi:hypothetical protein
LIAAEVTMRKDEHPEPAFGPDDTDALSSWMVAAGGSALASNPGTAHLGVAVGAAAPIVGGTVRLVHQFISEFKARRVKEVTDRVKERMEQEGVGDRFDDVKDVVLEAIPFIADAETEEKRQILEDVIVNATRRHDLTARTEASMALRLIKQMPAEAILVFGSIVASEGDQLSLKNNWKFSVGSDCFGLEWAIFEAGLASLGDLGLVTGDPRYPFSDFARVRSFGEVEFRLAHRALLLARWIERNPPSADAGTAGEETKP